jgi:hypothetical protein
MQNKPDFNTKVTKRSLIAFSALGAKIAASHFACPPGISFNLPQPPEHFQTKNPQK